jgi:MtN3 and saliva related transmembrane protein
VVKINRSYLYEKAYIERLAWSDSHTYAVVVPMLPQIINLKPRRQLRFVAVLLAGNCLWVYYGVDKSDLPIILTNLLTAALDITMLVLKYKYADNK